MGTAFALLWCTFIQIFALFKVAMVTRLAGALKTSRKILAECILVYFAVLLARLTEKFDQSLSRMNVQQAEREPSLLQQIDRKFLEVITR